MKKILSIFLVICTFMTILTAFPVNSTNSGKCGENLTWVLDDNGTLTISGTGAMYDDCFATNTNIKNVVINNGVCNISNRAFSRCFLHSVSIPETVSQIGWEAFKDALIDEITLPISVLSIGKDAFNVDSESGWSTPYGDYTGISTVNYGGSIEQWNNIKIISGNEKLQKAKKFNYNSNVSYSGSCGEKATWKITNKTLEILGSGAIKNYYGNGYGKDTLSYPIWLIYNYDTIKIHDGITHIGCYAFDEAITEYDMSESSFGIYYGEENQYGVKSYDNGKFYFNLDKAASVTIPKSVIEINRGAFSMCNRLKDVYYEGIKSDWAKIKIEPENTSLVNATIHYLGEPTQIVDVTGIILDSTSLSMNIGDSKKLSATIIPENATNKSITWSSSNEKVATVSNGIISALSAGTATITAKSEYNNAVAAKCVISVIPKKLTDVSLDNATYTYDGTEKSLAVTGNLPTGAKVEYTNEKATNAGTYNATAKITCEGYNDLTLKATLKINPAEISVKADDVQMVKGDEIPKLKFTITSGTLFGDDKITGELKVNTDGKTVGDFDITQGTLTAGSNYKINFTKGTLSVVDKTPQNITVADFGEKTYGDNSFKVEVTKDAVSNLDTFTYESSNPDVAEITADGNVTIKGAGEADITVYQAGDDEYAPFKKSVKLVVKKKAVTVTSVDIENKTAVLDGVLAEDAENVMLDFDKITIEQGEAVDETTVNITLKGFSLKGDKAANYEATTESLASVMANDKIVSVEITAENGTVTGAAKYIKGSSVTVTATANSGYKFKGWYADNATVSTESTYTFTADTDISLIAKFEKEYTGGTGKSSSSAGGCTIKLDTNGGNSLKNISVKKGQKIGTIETPKKDGYVFDGWYSDKALTKPYNSDETVTASKTLYASWKIDPVRQLTLTIGDKNATVFGEKKANDVAPIIRNDRTMLPARFVAENLGAKVEWDEEKQLVTITGKSLDGKEITILITIGSKTAKVNDKETELDSEAFIENDRTYTPVRFIAESLGASVEWNENAQEVIITK